MQTGSDEAPAHRHCQGASGGYSSPDHQYPPVSTSISFLFYSAQQPLAFAHLKSLLWWRALTMQSNNSAKKIKKKIKMAELCIKASKSPYYTSVCETMEISSRTKGLNSVFITAAEAPCSRKSWVIRYDSPHTPHCSHQTCISPQW